MRKQNKIEGQISFWEVEIPKVTTKQVIQQPEEIKDVSTKDITSGQGKVIDKYKVLDGLNRVIHYCGGGVGIELSYGERFKTIYVNRKGEEEFVIQDQATTLPLDKIILTKNEYKELNDIQNTRLQELKEKYKIKDYIKRKGDKNVIVKVEGKVISINPSGWILEFSEAIYEKHEVITFKGETHEYSVGDTVEALWGKEKIVGKIYSKYSDKEAFNIVWDNKHSAFHKSKILRNIA